MPDDFTFTLEAVGEDPNTPAIFYTGSVISYKLSIHASAEETDVKVTTHTCVAISL